MTNSPQAAGTWEETIMGAVAHTGECDVCERYMVHLSSSWAANEAGLRALIKHQKAPSQIPYEPSAVWEEVVMGCLCHTVPCDLCNGYLTHVTDNWGGDEPGLRALVKRRQNQFSQPAHEDLIPRLTAERDHAVRASQEATERLNVQTERINLLALERENAVKASQEAAEGFKARMEHISLLTVERDNAVKASNEAAERLNEQMERASLLISQLEAERVLNEELKEKLKKSSNIKQTASQETIHVNPRVVGDAAEMQVVSGTHSKKRARRSPSLEAGTIPQHQEAVKTQPSVLPWNAPLEQWARHFLSTAHVRQPIDGVRVNKGVVKLRQVRGFILVASRAPLQNVRAWHRMCAELLAFPGEYKKLTSQADDGHMIEDHDEHILHIAPQRTMRPANVQVAETVWHAARELALQGVTIAEVDDAQPYGFWWLMDNMNDRTMGQEIQALIRQINRVPNCVVQAVPRFEPQTYEDPAQVSQRDKKKASRSKRSRRSKAEESSDDDGGVDSDERFMF
ncbi:hypothetical protein EYR38_001994 [Pleurotus pulmonarius]|nr:hypothetical protein EYR38_001994 [Pleurotus pulmonarius]